MNMKLPYILFWVAFLTNYSIDAQYLGGTGDGGTHATSSLIPLPVSYTFFNAIPNNQSPRFSILTWGTSSEINNSHFEVEWLSTSSYTWEKVGMLPSQGNSYAEQHYEFIHKKPSSFNKYRLKQVDWDGNYSYSLVRTVWFDLTDPKSLTHLYPNPTKDKFTLVLVGAPKGNYSLFDAMGRLLEMGICQDEQSFSGLATGVYLLRIQVGEIVETKRINVVE